MKKVLTGVGVMGALVGWGGARETVKLGEKGTFFPWKGGADTTAWTRVSAEVPAGWKGSRVAVEVPYALVKCDMVLYLNGEKAGEILRPAGSVDVSGKVRYGETNEFAWVLTESGKLTERGEAKTVAHTHHMRKGLSRAPDLVKTPKDYIVDVFANTSWRQKKVTFECETTGGGEVEIEVRDAEGKVVKRGKGRGNVEIPWEDPICWELGRPYLYTAKAKYGEDEQEIRFGFREVWREGKEIMMNGHKAHWRPAYAFGVRRHGAEFMMDIGYNVVGFFHSADSVSMSDGLRENLDEFDEVGMGVFVCAGGGLNIVKERSAEDPETAKLYREFQKTFHRYTRNHPSVMAAYVTQMIICDRGAHDPVNLGMNEGGGARARLINLFRDVNREYNPNILYYSHADGNNGDMASGNLYLNFTPLQEREEWLSNWAEGGVMPWCSVEFGQPYNGNWSKGKTFLPTEHLAIQYGDRAYEEEPVELLPLMLKAGADNKTGHGSKAAAELLVRNPLFWELRKLWTWRTNSRWRGFGHGGGNVYFNLTEAYGDPPGGKSYGRYRAIKEPLNHKKPEWANEAYDIHQLGNKDFCAYLGGAPAHTDRTHAYWAGEEVKKQLVAVWDGVGEKKVAMRVEAPGYVKTFEATLKQGEIAKIPFSFRAPEVAKKTRYEVKADFGGEFADGMEIEVYPRGAGKVDTRGKRTALYDPSGEGAEILDALGVGYEKVKKMGEALKGFDALIVGKNALEKSGFEVTPEALKAGLKVMVLPQTPKTWRAFGFNVQDTMSREVFVRSPELGGLEADELRHWRGAPRYGEKDHGAVMTHSTQRGPRWKRTHTVAGLVLETPPQIGFLPLMECEFDMAYSPLLRFYAGEGTITYCTLDFEKRVGADPAATKAAREVFGEFYGQRAPKGGKVGSEIAVEADAAATTTGGVYRVKRPAGGAWAWVGPQLLRWSVGLPVKAGADGKVKIREDMLDAKAAGCAENERAMHKFNALKLRKLFARLRTAGGEKAEDLVVRRMTHLAGAAAFEALPAFHAAGPFSSGEDNTKLMLDTVWNRQAEEMMVAGDDNPNIEFPLPQGGTTNWRRMVTPVEGGKFDFGAGAMNPVHYAFSRIERKRAGKAKLKFGADWRARFWLNGKEVWRMESGAHYPKFEMTLDLKEGENILAVKLGGGRTGCTLWAALEAEREDGEGRREADPELEAVRLYGSEPALFDPYVFHYW